MPSSDTQFKPKHGRAGEDNNGKRDRTYVAVCTAGHIRGYNVETKFYSRNGASDEHDLYEAVLQHHSVNHLG